MMVTSTKRNMTRKAGSDKDDFRVEPLIEGKFKPPTFHGKQSRLEMEARNISSMKTEL